MGEEEIVKLLGAAAVAIGGWLVRLALRDVKDVKKEITPNGGASMKDQVTRIETVLTRVEDRQIIQDQRLERIDERGDRVDARIQSIEDDLDSVKFGLGQ